jgi:hypothetical protein
MADDNDSRERTTGEQPSRVELRSDSIGGSRGGFTAKIYGIDRKWWIIGSIVLLLIVLPTLLFFVFRQPSALGEERSVFGNLPRALDADRRRAVSGLSGRQCEAADRRAIGVMLAADPITRPVSGFAEADMVWELPVLVSDVTRLLAVYQCGRPADIGSVRSARHDYLFLAEGVDAIVAHWGGSYHALNRIAAGEFKTINALTNPFGAYFRKNDLPAPYNGFTTYENLWNALQKLGYRTTTEFKGYDFKNDAEPAARPGGGKLSVGWPGAYRVHYEYDRETNRYVRFWASTRQVDGGGERADVAPSAVVIMRAGNSFADGPGGYNDVDIEGEGSLEVYQDGQVIRGTWRKDERYKNDPVYFVDESGKPIVFTRGQLWVMAVEPEIAVAWEVAQAAAPTVSPADGNKTRQ